LLPKQVLYQAELRSEPCLERTILFESAQRASGFEGNMELQIEDGRSRTRRVG